jgi:hypothetical protein
LFLRSVKAETQTDYWDTKTPAFGVRVGKNAKTFVAKIGNRRITIGTYGEGGLTLAEARKKALSLKGESTLASREKRTLSDTYEQWKDSVAAKKPRTQRDYKRMMDKYFIPNLGKKRLAEITFEQITKETKGLKESEAAHALAVARTFFRWCVRPPRRYIPHSALEGLQVSMGKARKRILKDAELAQNACRKTQRSRTAPLANCWPPMA